MKKKLLASLLAALLCLSLAACGGSPAPSGSQSPTSQPPADATPAPTDASSGVTVDEGLLTVDLTLPASIFEGQDMSAFDPDGYASTQGFIKAALNDDGSVTVTMSKEKHQALLEEMTLQYEQNFAAMIGAEETPYIKDITHTDNFGIITADVDRAAYEALPFDLTSFSLGLSGMMYQAFTGDDPHVEVVIRDADTGDTITSSVYPDDVGGA